MSANLAQKKLIDILVTAAVTDAEKLPKEGVIAITGGMSKEAEERLRKECNILGAMLWAANYEYYSEYYQEANDPPQYVFEQEHADPAVVLAAVELYEDQTNEDPAGDVAFHCNDIRRRLVGKLPVIEEQMQKMRHLI